MIRSFRLAEVLWQRFPRAGFVAVRLAFALDAAAFAWRGSADRVEVAWILATAPEP